MKKIVVVAVCLLMAGTAFAGPMTLKVGPIYGLLMSPDLSDIEDMSGADVSKGGIGFNAQLLLGDERLKYGAGIGYLPLFKYEYSISQTFYGQTYTMSMDYSGTAIPVIGIVNYEVSEAGGSVIPYVNAGLGLAMVTAKAEVEVMGTSESSSDSKSGYCLMLGGGVAIEAGESMDIDLSLNYYNIGVKFEIGAEEEATSLLGIGAAVSFLF